VNKVRPSITALFLLAFLLTTVVHARGDQADAELQALGFLAGEEPAAFTARSPRPISKTAENVTVITAEQIALLNAHTLAEVLQTIPGIQLEQLRTPGSFTFFDLQGASSRGHVQVFIDGVRQNDLVETVADVGLIPVQQIERVEIVKGSASAAWGQALGGVVNVITKAPAAERPLGGMVSASYGERLTTDLRGEVSGTVGRFGYYLSGGNLHSDGLLPTNGINRNNGYGKLTYDLPGKGALTLGLDYLKSSRGLFESADFNLKSDADTSSGYSFLAFSYPLDRRLSLDLSARLSRLEREVFGRALDDRQLLMHALTKESNRGASARLTWGDSLNNLVTGLEYEHAEVRQAVLLNQADLTERTMDRWGAYANGALSLGPLTLLPGARFDHTGIGSDELSYTLGLTCRLTEKTILRGYGARGYSLPVALVLHGPEKVWTVQAGAESEEIPYLWLKGTFFYNDAWDIEQADSSSGTLAIVLKEQIRRGFELEARTVPVHGFSLAGGYTFTDARDSDSRARLKGVPVNQAKLSLRYDNALLGLKGLVSGNYVWWNAEESSNGKYTGTIWDLHLTQRLMPGRELSPELFFSLHNLFDGAQYADSIFKNTGRWLEGGVRFRF
jgi:vitamin B12 transporter